MVGKWFSSRDHDAVQANGMALRALEPTVEQCLEVELVLSEGTFSRVEVVRHTHMLTPDEGLVLKTLTKVCVEEFGAPTVELVVDGALLFEQIAHVCTVSVRAKMFTLKNEQNKSYGYMGTNVMLPV